jgi:flagellar protein FlaG
MEMSLGKVLIPVSPDLPTSNDRSQTTAQGTERPGAVSPVAELPQRKLQAQMAAIASQLQEFLSTSDRDIEFRVDADTHAQVVTVRDATSGEVIRQFPSEDVLRVLKNVAAQQGTLLDEIV